MLNGGSAKTRSTQPAGRAFIPATQSPVTMRLSGGSMRGRGVRERGMDLGILPALARGTLPMTRVGGDALPLALALPGYRLFERGLVGVEARGMGRPCGESCVRGRGALILAPLLNYASTPNVPEAYRAKFRSW